MKLVMQDIFLKVMFNIQKYCMSFMMIYSFCLNKRKLKKLKNLYPICMIKMLYRKETLKIIKSCIVFEKVQRATKFNQEACLRQECFT